MPDITKCRDEQCPAKDHCYRYTAKPSFYQSYFFGTPRKEDGTCTHYWGEEAEAIMKQLADVLNQPRQDNPDN